MHDVRGGKGAMTPIAPAERIEALDVIRGAALFGIIAANMRAFNTPQPAYFNHFLMWTGTGDWAVQSLIDLFITGKFVTLFSFLFGVGFAVQMDRASARGVSPRPFYLRRLGVLLVIGLAHMFLLWWGDILTAYALAGFFLLLFRDQSQRTVLLWAGILYAWPLILSGAALAVSTGGAHLPMPVNESPAELRRIVDIFARGTYAQMFHERVGEAALNLASLFAFYPRSLGLFLFGLWTWRSGVIQQLGTQEALLKRCRNWGLVVGLAGSGAVLAIDEVFHPDPVSFNTAGFVAHWLSSLGTPALSLFYASTLALLSIRTDWRPRLHPFAAVGRMPLTNYLLQTAVCTTLFNSWGFGLYGKVGPLVGLAPTFMIYGAELAGSLWWISRFTFGPMEWLWRSLTYGRTMALRAAA